MCFFRRVLLLYVVIIMGLKKLSLRIASKGECIDVISVV